MTSGGHHSQPASPVRPGSRGGSGQHTVRAVPQWRQCLEQLPAYDPGTHLTARDRELYRAAIVQAHHAGGKVQDIAVFLGRSYTSVRTLLDEAGLRTTPAADEVESALRDRITDGTYRVDDVLPAKQELCEELGVTRDAVTRAIGRLAAEGLLLSVYGRGTVVIDPRTPPTGPALRVRTTSGKWETWRVRAEPGVQRIRDTVIRRVLDGTYTEGDTIPSTRTLAQEFGVLHHTVDRALAPLKQSGLLATRPASGTFVHRKARSLLQSTQTHHPSPRLPARQPR
ncbi:GntR family transcriptional regulator [Streptomyces sp. NPDC001107]